MLGIFNLSLTSFYQKIVCIQQQFYPSLLFVNTLLSGVPLNKVRIIAFLSSIEQDRKYFVSAKHSSLLCRNLNNKAGSIGVPTLQLILSHLQFNPMVFARMSFTQMFWSIISPHLLMKNALEFIFTEHQCSENMLSNSSTKCYLCECHLSKHFSALLVNTF